MRDGLGLNNDCMMSSLHWMKPNERDGLVVDHEMSVTDVRPSLHADKVRDGRGVDHDLSRCPTFTACRRSARWAGRGP